MRSPQPSYATPPRAVKARRTRPGGAGGPAVDLRAVPLPSYTRPKTHDPEEIEVVFFPRLMDTRPVPWRGTWTQLADRLGRHQERGEKDGPGWSPARYRTGATRGNAGVLALTVLVTEFDHTEPPWALWDGLAYAAYTTHSHAEDDPRWRVAIRLRRPVPAPQWDDVIARAMRSLTPGCDPACKDAGRYFYLPSCRAGAPRAVRRGEGRPLDPAELPPAPEPPPTPERLRAAPGEQGGRPGDDFNRRADWRTILEPHGWRLVYERGGEGFWRRPGKRQGVSATTGFDGVDLLFCFSSSAAPLEPRTWYTPFNAYAVLQHGGDHAQAARSLAERGYGEPHRVWRGLDGIRRQVFVPASTPAGVA